VTVFARDINKARLLDVPCVSLSAVSFAGYDIVVNATPESPATAEQLRGAGWVYDLVYNPIETQFIKEARKAGCETLGGLEMLVAQAKIQFELWTGKKPASSVMYNAASSAIS